MDYMDLIKTGESKTLEFKENIPTGNKLAKTIISFSNTAGGKILIGIKNNKEIKGLNEVSIINIKNKSVLMITVYPGSLKPYYLKGLGRDRGTYIRVGAINKKADNYIINELLRNRMNVSFDEEIVYDFEISNLDIKRFCDDFKNYTGKLLDSSKMINMKLYKNENGKLFPSKGLVLLAGNSSYFDYSGIKCARFKGNEMDEFIDQKEYLGPLYEIIEQAMAFIKNHINKYGKSY